MFGKKSKPHSKDKPKPEIKVSKPQPKPVVVEVKEKVIDHCLCCEAKCQCCEHPVGITTHFCQCKCHA